MLTTSEINDWIMENFDDVVIKAKYGETTYFYNKDKTLPHGVYFFTIKESDGPNDKASRLDRPGVFRVSWQLERAEFEEKFGDLPPRPAKGESISTNFDLSRLDTHLPHAVYGWMGWSMILAPKRQQFELQKDSIRRAYGRAKRKFDERLRR